MTTTLPLPSSLCNTWTLPYTYRIIILTKIWFFIRKIEKSKAKKQSIHTYIVHNYVNHIPMMPHDIIPCQTFLHFTTQWCHMESFIFKHLCMSQPNNVIWHLTSKKKQSNSKLYTQIFWSIKKRMVQNLQSKHCDKNKFLKKQIKKKEVKEFLSF